MNDSYEKVEFPCEKCGKMVDLLDESVNADWMPDDDDDERTLYQIDWTCPHCGYGDNYTEIWY